MKKILDDIVLNKRLEVEIRKPLYPVEQFEHSPFFYRQPLSMADFILNDANNGIVAEFKRRSPSKGLINGTAEPGQVTSQYTKHGAAALSVLTDQDYFAGSDNDLRLVAENRTIPLLRKDFTVDSYQILEARALGADAILLIAAILSKNEVRDLSRLARSLGMEVLLELHGEEEFDKIDTDIQLIGINNRNLQSFEVSIEHSIRLAEKLPADKVRIAESGIHSAETLVELRNNGFDGCLIGERFMREAEPGEAVRLFNEQVSELKKRPL